MPDLAVVRAKLTEDMDQLIFEIDTLWEQFEATQFFGNGKNFPNAHYGYMISIFARFDLLSRYWKGTEHDQTGRMVAFMNKYVAPRKNDANRTAVKLWRHTVMHTAEARLLENPSSNEAYTWRLDFGRRDCIPSYEFPSHPNDGTMVLWLVMTEFVRLVQAGQARYLDDLDQDAKLQSNFDREEPKIIRQKFIP